MSRVQLVPEDNGSMKPVGSPKAPTEPEPDTQPCQRQAEREEEVFHLAADIRRL
jgi:hypothetical protein